MHHHLSVFDVLTHASHESLMILPYLFIAYLILEYLERKTQNVSLFFAKTHSAFAPVLATLLGILPQCGLSVAGANFYAARVISTGTLVALFLATSDEMLPVLLSNQVPLSKICSIIFYKSLIAVMIGLFLDKVLKKKNHGAKPSFQMNLLCKEVACGCCHSSLWLSALKHTLNIFLFIFIINIILNFVFHSLMPHELKESLFQHNVFGPLFASLFGLIPNCAPSVISAQLYADNALQDGTFLSAVLANSGIGLFVLFHVNRKFKQNLKIMLCLFLTAFISGLIFNAFNIHF
ncbi:MAG: arsenic efflux protein [Alphaproteobacteria bacterium]|nr:arsenic efflux protein [Alphaproteobacteria bacterium]